MFWYVVLFLFFAIPPIVLAFLGICIYRYVAAKRQNRRVPGTHSEKAIRKRGHMLIIASLLAGAVLVLYIALMVLLSLAIAYM